MQSELDSKLEKARQGTDRLHKIDSMLQNLNTERPALEEKSARLKAILDKENLDVEKLEKMSLTHLFSTVLGNSEEKLEKERREALAARLKYGQVEKDLEDVKRRIERLVSERRELENSRAEYDRLFALKKEELLREKGDKSQQILPLMEKANFLKARKKEIFEALCVGNDILMKLEKALGSLDSAAGWGTFDLLGGGLVANIAKHSHIDEAKQEIEDVQRMLILFRSELADVKMSSDMDIETGGFAMFADFFFDGLIADWYMQSKINSSRDSVCSAIDQIKAVMAKLEVTGDSDNMEMERLEKQISDMIINGQQTN